MTFWTWIHIYPFHSQYLNINRKKNEILKLYILVFNNNFKNFKYFLQCFDAFLLYKCNICMCVWVFTDVFKCKVHTPSFWFLYNICNLYSIGEFNWTIIIYFYSIDPVEFFIWPKEKSFFNAFSNFKKSTIFIFLLIMWH